MRLIDADKYKREIMDIMACWNISPCLSPDEQRKSVGNLKTALNVLDEMPTAFDLENAFQKVSELQLSVKDKALSVDDEEYAVMLRGRLRGIADVLEILKSAINATSGKNGGIK